MSRTAILTSRAVQDVCCCFLPLRARGRCHARDCSGAAEAWCVPPLVTPPASASRPAREEKSRRPSRPCSGLGFVSRAPERVPPPPGEPRTPPNAFASSGTRLPWTAGGQFGPGGRASGHPVAVGVAVFPESDVPHQWITYRRAMVFLSAARRRGEARLSPLLTVSDPPRFRPPPFAWKQPPPSRPKPARR